MLIRNTLSAILIVSQALIFASPASTLSNVPARSVRASSADPQPTPPVKTEPAGPYPAMETAPDFRPPDLPADTAIRSQPGFNSYTLPANDDGYTDSVALGFAVNFFQRTYASLFVNNNGNVTFDSPQATYTPYDLTSTQRVIIAPFFADVDTRGSGSGLTRYGRDTVDGRPAFGVNWFDVGYFAAHADKLNTFQLVLIDRSDLGAGSFDVEFNYAQVRWETGDASGGSGGLGGYSARAGYSNGTGAPGTSYEINGSAINGAFLDSNASTGLIHRSVNSSTRGRYRFEVRNGTIVTPTPTRTATATPTTTTTTAPTNTISGRVTNLNGTAGITGVTVRDNAGHSTTTNASGHYTLSGLTAGTYRVTPFKASYTFLPEFIAVTVPPSGGNINFTGGDKPPIVFVHGWNGGPRSLLCDWSQVQPASYFEQVDDRLRLEGYYVEYARLDSSTCYTPRIEANVIRLENAIALAKTATRQSKVILIAHSMGGLVSRAYIEGGTYHDDVSHLFTFGTPHQGVPVDALALFANGQPLATYCSLSQPAVCDFSVTGMALFNLLHPARTTDVKYHVISGAAPSVPRTLVGFLGDVLLIGPDDGAVPTWSGVGLSGNLDRWQTDEAHNGTIGPRNYFVRDAGDSTSYLQCLKRVLVDHPPTDHCGTVGPVETSQDVSTSSTQHSPFLYGTLLPGQTNQRPIALEGGATMFAAQWTPGTVLITLVDPSGQIIDAAYAAAHPSIVTYEASEGYAAYSFPNAAAGTWQMRLLAGNVPATGSTYTAFATFDSGLTLSGGTNRSWYQAGATAVITTTLSPAPQSATVAADVLLVDGTNTNVTMTALGGGRYQGSYLVPATPGYAEVRLSATGININGNPFERGTSLAFQIAPNTVALNGVYTDTPEPRWPGAPIYQALGVTIGVNVNVAGAYGVSADLVDPLGNPVAHANTIADLSGGGQSLSLRFRGADIYASQHNGPYTLTNLLLTDHHGATLVVQEATNVYTTAAYEYLDFRTGDLFLPLIFTTSGGVPPSATATATPTRASTPTPTATVAVFTPTSTRTPSPTVTITPTPTPTQGTSNEIVFRSNRDGNFEIYTMRADGTNQIRLTNNSFDEDRPSWAPDGVKIAFVSNRDGNTEIYRMARNGSGQTRLTNNGVEDGSPAWSPDGQVIAYQNKAYGNWDIFKMNSDGSGQARLTDNGAWDEHPDWSPDGTKIAFESYRGGQWDIYVMNPDGSGQTRLTTNSGADRAPKWSPDGTQMAFFSDRDGDSEIYVMNAGGSNQTRLTYRPGWDVDPVWSPDGQRIAFMSIRDGNWNIYVMNYDGSGQTRLTNSSSEDSSPDWLQTSSSPIPSGSTMTWRSKRGAIPNARHSLPTGP